MTDDGWVRVGALDDLPEGRSVRVAIEGSAVMLHRTEERIFAIGNRCSHQGAPLDRGPVRVGPTEATVTCPLHGSTFRLEDGGVARGPATTPVPAFDVRITDGSIELRPKA